MGNGAGKQKAAPARTMSVAERVERGRKAAPGYEHETDDFHNACMAVFKSADVDRNGSLDYTEFWNVLTSETLNLNLSDDEMNEIRDMADVDKDGSISYSEFIPVVKTLLKMVYQRKEEDWNDWCEVSDASTGKVFFLNKRTGEISKQKPANFNPERQEIRSFEYITLKDGTEVTTYVEEDGQRMYMDWDSNQWKPFPKEWLTQVDASDSQESVDAEDPRVGEYNHPTRGVLATFLFENTRNTRLYYDEDLGQWARMPLGWEFNVPEVRTMLKQLEARFPKWKNANEQILALRECDYDLADTIAFAEINFANASSAGTSSEALARISELERQLAAKQKEADELRAQREEETSTAQRQLVREKTKVEGLSQRQQRAVADSQEKIEDLTARNEQLREKLSTLENKLVQVQSDADRAKELEAQLAAHTQSDEVSSTIKDLTTKAESTRMENVALKLKLQALKDKMGKQDSIRTQLAILQKSVAYMKREQQDTHKELHDNINQLNPMFDAVVGYSRRIKENTESQLKDITAKYLHEQTQRKLLYNKVQELRGNIRVFCRVRHDPRGECVFKFPSENEVVVQKLQGGTDLLDFEHCYGPDSLQSKVFDDTKPLILSCIDGYNVCIMAYGQTGSGKTYTMMGPKDNPGVNRRAIKELIDTCDARDEVDFTITVSMMEVYNEHIYDLLKNDRNTSLQIRLTPTGKTYVDGAMEVTVKTQEEIINAMDIGNQNRSTGATLMNTDSSRSHLLFRLSVRGVNKISGQQTSGTLTLVDLAGSERISKTEASGERLVEAAAINKSLTALGQVFKALATNAPHVPYRNSKLTHALADSLGGDAKTAVFVNVSPLASNLSETWMTLKFGQNIRKIELGPAKKNKNGPPKPRK